MLPLTLPYFLKVFQICKNLKPYLRDNDIIGAQNNRKAIEIMKLDNVLLNLGVNLNSLIVLNFKDRKF